MNLISTRIQNPQFLASEQQPRIPEVASVLQVLGEGATGEILLALRQGPLRTKQLTRHVPRFTPRTVYRRTAALVERGLVDRQHETGVPSTVIHRLSEPTGRDLIRTLDRYAPPALSRGTNGKIVDGSWAFLALLGEMWSSGWIEQFSRGARNSTELCESTEGLTFHQVNRRLQLLVTAGLLTECIGQSRRKHYRLTDEARRATVLLAALGRWQQRHTLEGGRSGLLVQEIATVLRACLPLINLPSHRDASIRLGVVGAADCEDDGSATLRARIGRKGAIRYDSDNSAAVDSWAVGTVNTWSAALLHGNRGHMRVGGDSNLVDAFLAQLMRLCKHPNKD